MGNEKNRNAYYMRKFNYSKGNSKQTWGNINNLLNRKKSSDFSLNSDTGVHIDNVTLPDYVNEYFVSSVNELTENFDNTDVTNTCNDSYRVNNSCFCLPLLILKLTVY